MAKVCRNCGRKIGFNDPFFRLKQTSEYLCTDCGGRIMPLFEDLKNTVDLESFRKKKLNLWQVSAMQTGMNTRELLLTMSLTFFRKRK